MVRRQHSHGASVALPEIFQQLVTTSSLILLKIYKPESNSKVQVLPLIPKGHILKGNIQFWTKGCQESIYVKEKYNAQFPKQDSYIP